MAVLNAAKRNSLPASEFGEPGSRKYPMENKGHASNAKARADQAYEAGHISGSTYEKIVAKANKVLKRK